MELKAISLEEFVRLRIDASLLGGQLKSKCRGFKSKKPRSAHGYSHPLLCT